MSNNGTTGQKSSGPMAPLESYTVDCSDCDFREQVDGGEWAAESVARTHAGRTDHDLPGVEER
jgi:hypothetical protein